jgi:hypothetical protein
LDFNGDGLPDYATLNDYGANAIYINNGGGFDPIINTIGLRKNNCITDYNNDGTNEIICIETNLEYKLF